MNKDQRDEYAATIGRVAVLMGKSDLYCQYPIACLSIWIRPAIFLRQIYFFKDVSGADVGYMTWARLASDTEQRLRHDPEVILHVTEWNEGEQLWIMDFVSVDGKVRQKIREAAKVLADTTIAQSLRRYEDGQVRSVAVWRPTRWRTALDGTSR